MKTPGLDPRLRLVQQAEIKDKVVLVRVDHNVVKNGRVKDPYRIDVSFKTLYLIAEKGGRPILMTHVGRPLDKKTGRIVCDKNTSVSPVVEYLRKKLPVRIVLEEMPLDPDLGISGLGESILEDVRRLRAGEIGMIYLPNTRWFQGEQSSGPVKDRFTRWLAGLAHMYVNDAFSSWQAHASTCDIAGCLPSYAGLQLQEELLNLERVLNPQRPLLGIIAGAKYDTKIGPVHALHKRADSLILGGVLYNVFLAAREGVDIAGVSDEDKALARELVEMDAREKKIIDLRYLTVSGDSGDKAKGACRTVCIRDIGKDVHPGPIVDIDPRSYEDEKVIQAVAQAGTIFVNAVMGLTPPFSEGTRELYRLVAANRTAVKLFAGGDTLQEMRNLCPDLYLAGTQAPDYFFFTGGGSVLTALEKGNPYDLKPVRALMKTP